MAAVLLFDGTCNFCNGAVGFVLDHERAPELSFAALQSDAGRALLEAAAGEARARAIIEADTVVLVEDGRVYTNSDAALRVARRLREPWRSLAALGVVPRPVRDALYDAFARRRYRWFGKTDECRVPTPELRARFL